MEKRRSPWISIVLFVAAVVFALLSFFLQMDAGELRSNIAGLTKDNQQLTEQVEALQEEKTALSTELQAAKDELAGLREDIANMYVAPRVRFSTDEAIQGDIVTVIVEMNSAQAEPTIETPLGEPHFVHLEDGSQIAFVPVGYAQTPGDYEIRVGIEDVEYVSKLHVGKREYGEQHMTMSSSTAASTVGASGANQDWNEKIVSLFDSWDDEKYWTVPFVQPVEGRISTQFGLYRYTTYTDGGSRTTRHTGIDIACPEGTPVPTSNAGRVVFAGEVIITGNTVVIEHGGGLKTYYYHLNKISCQAGDMVSPGDIIGEVGMTGYATGPHLHFEVRIGNMSLSPWEMFDGSSDLYKFD